MTKNLSPAHFIAIAAITLTGLAPLQSAHAASVLYQDLTPTGILSSPSSITRSFASGSGADIIFANPNGATYSAVNFGFFNGGLLNVSIPVTFAAGNHVLTFDYAGADQGLGDEGWGLNNITVEGVSAVPEPDKSAMLLPGVGMFGFMARRPKNDSV